MRRKVNLENMTISVFNKEGTLIDIENVKGFEDISLSNSDYIEGLYQQMKLYQYALLKANSNEDAIKEYIIDPLADKLKLLSNKDVDRTSFNIEACKKYLLRILKQDYKRNSSHIAALKNIFPGEVLDVPKVEKLLNYKPRRATNYIIPNSKVVNKLTNIIEHGEASVEVIKPTKKQKGIDVDVVVSVDYDLEGTSLSTPFTAYDREVHNAFISLYEAGNTHIDSKAIYRVMNGLTNTEKVSPQACGAVTRSLEKARRTKFTIDFTAEMKARGVSVDNAFIDDYLFNAKRISMSANGATIDAYEVHSPSPIYEYNKLNKQVITVPITLLNTKKVINSTEDITVIRNYLIRRIEEMKNTKNKLSNKIRYETIMDLISMSNPSKTEYSRFRKNIDRILSFWVSEKYIKGFKIYKEGKSFAGIELFF